MNAKSFQVTFSETHTYAFTRDSFYQIENNFKCNFRCKFKQKKLMEIEMLLQKDVGTIVSGKP